MTRRSPASKVICVAVLVAIACGGTSYAQSAADAELRAQVAALRAEQARIAELQRQTDARLRELEARLGAEGTPASETRVAAAPTLVVADAAPPRLHIAGDLRLRTQGDYADEVRDRLSGQVRGRLGATFAANDTVTFGARLVTGDPDDPNSTDVQLSNFDDDLQVSLDLAYAQLNFGDIKLYGGKIPQPFARTDLVWDSDVNPQGASVVYRRAVASGGAFRANGLFFIVDESALGADSTMTGAQLGYDSVALGHWKFDVSAAYYDYRLGSIAGGDAGDFRTNLRDGAGNYLSDFNLGDLQLGATWSGSDRWPVRVLGDYVHNFGAETSADTGYGVDFALGRASKPSDWRMTYGYSVAETDSVLAAFSHDNIALGTNYRLHALTFDYVPLPKTLISAIWYHYQPYHLEPGSIDTGWIDRLRLAFTVSF